MLMEKTAPSLPFSPSRYFNKNLGAAPVCCFRRPARRDRIAPDCHPQRNARRDWIAPDLLFWHCLQCAVAKQGTVTSLLAVCRCEARHYLSLLAVCRCEARHCYGPACSVPLRSKALFVTACSVTPSADCCPIWTLKRRIRPD